VPAPAQYSVLSHWSLSTVSVGHNFQHAVDPGHLWRATSRSSSGRTPTAACGTSAIRLRPQGHVVTLLVGASCGAGELGMSRSGRPPPTSNPTKIIPRCFYSPFSSCCVSGGFAISRYVPDKSISVGRGSNCYRPFWRRRERATCSNVGIESLDQVGEWVNCEPVMIGELSGKSNLGGCVSGLIDLPLLICPLLLCFGHCKPLGRRRGRERWGWLWGRSHLMVGWCFVRCVGRGGA
jgi:hypothetical protein